MTEISLSWEPVTDAETYEIILKGPDGEKRKVGENVFFLWSREKNWHMITRFQMIDPHSPSNKIR